jgi:hypothetical protein
MSSFEESAQREYNFLIKITRIVTLACFVNGYAFSAYSANTTESDSLKIFFTGTRKGETFKVVFDKKRVLKFRTNNAYTYSTTIPKMAIWETRHQIVELRIYRKGFLGLFYHRVAESLGYESDKQFLILRRATHLRNSISFFEQWSDREPHNPGALY